LCFDLSHLSISHFFVSLMLFAVKHYCDWIVNLSCNHIASCLVNLDIASMLFFCVWNVLIFFAFVVLFQRNVNWWSRIAGSFARAKCGSFIYIQIKSCGRRLRNSKVPSHFFQRTWLIGCSFLICFLFCFCFRQVRHDLTMLILKRSTRLNRTPIVRSSCAFDLINRRKSNRSHWLPNRYIFSSASLKPLKKFSQFWFFGCQSAAKRDWLNAVVDATAQQALLSAGTPNRSRRGSFVLWAQLQPTSDLPTASVLVCCFF
jgi:hypothetical protein